jgi:hypothetical protein
MDNDINRRILVKIEGADCDPKVKSFLTEMLQFELEHISEVMPHYTKEYKQAIKNRSRLEPALDGSPR